ncbi:hypothetical protein HT031_006692 [Scenedesmus sp. PABB004]|nr:hypothetical protein HT031_006692 [Scenedesmus sp. PABB004]
MSTMTSNLAASVNAITNMPYAATRTNMEGGVRYCFNNDASLVGGATTPPGAGILTTASTGLPRILMLLTDGEPNQQYNSPSIPGADCCSSSGTTCCARDSNNNCINSASNCFRDGVKYRADVAKNASITFISIGVGVSPSQAAWLSSISDKYYNVANFSALAATVADIVRGVCTDAAVVKSVVPSATTLGNSLTWTVTINNAGLYAITSGVSFTDTLPAGVTYNSAVGVVPGTGAPTPTCAYNSGTRKLACNITSGSLAVAGQWQFVYQTLATDAGNQTNAVEITTNPDGNDNNDNAAASAITTRTCARNSVNATTGAAQQFPCGTGSQFNTANANSTTVNQATCCTSLPDMTITKTASATSVFIGDLISYTLTATNLGPGAASNVTVTDTLPAGLDFVSAGSPGCSAVGQAVTCGPSAAVAAGANVTYVVQARAITAGTKNNQARVSANNDYDPTNNGPSDVSVTVTQTCARNSVNATTGAAQQFPCGTGSQFNTANANSTTVNQATCCTSLPDMTITKTASATSVFIGDLISYTLTATNLGPGAASNVTVTDTLPAGLDFVSAGSPGCSAVGQAVTCGPSAAVAAGANVTYVVQARAITAGTKNNQARVSANNDYDPTNNGPSDVSVTVTQTCARNSVNATTGAAQQFPCGTGSQFNTANANSTTVNQATCCTSLPDMTITKTASATSVFIGDLISYTLTATNLGPGAASNVTVTDTLPAGLDFVSAGSPGCSAVGQAVTCGPSAAVAAGANVTYVVQARAITAGTKNNQARVSANNDYDPTNNGPSDVSVTVTQTCARNSVNATTGAAQQFPCGTGSQFNTANANSTTVNQATCCTSLPDMTITKTASASTVTINDQLNFTLTATNGGQGSASGVSVTDTLPAGLQFVTPLPTGCSASGQALICGPSTVAAGASVVYVVRAKAVADGTWNNSARVSAPDDFDPTNNGPSVATVCVRKSCAASFVNQCGTFTAGCGGTVSCSCPSNLICSGGTCTTPPPNLFNDVSITMAGPGFEAAPGQPFNFTLTVAATGTQASSNVVVVNTLPAGVELLTTPPGCTLSAPVLTCNLGLLQVSETRTITLTVKAAQPGSFTNSAEVSAFLDVDPTNNKASATAVVKGSADMAITKTASASSVLIGNQLNYTLTATNAGSGPATGVVVTDTLPAGLLFVSATPSNCSASGNKVTCGPSNVAAGASVVYVLRAKAVAAGVQNNSATVSVPGDTNTTNNGPSVAPVTVVRTCAQYQPDGSPFNCTGGTVPNTTAANSTSPSQAACCTGAPVPDMSIAKTASATSVSVGDELTYTLTATNEGTGPATGVIVNDALPAGLQFVTPLPTGCSASGQALTCGPSAVAAGANVVYVVRAKAIAAGATANSATVSAPGDTNPGNNGPVVAPVTVCRTCAANFTNQCGSFDDGCGARLNCSCPTTLPFCVLGLCSGSIGPQAGGDVSMTKDGPTRQVVGQVFNFTLTVRVESLDDAQNVVITDTLPDGLTLVAVTPLTGCTVSANSLTCAIGRLAASGPPYVLTVSAKATRAGAFTNTARVNATDDLNQANNVDTATVTVVAGVCCSPSGSCRVVAPTACTGTYKFNETCATAQCTPVGPVTGACCAGRACTDNSTRAGCDQAAGVFKPNEACTADLCGPPPPAPAARAVRAAREGCRGENQPCGECANGGVCCDGLTCKWDHKGKVGVCKKPFTCKFSGDSCSSATECCPGTTCGADGKVRDCNCNAKCDKDDTACEEKRRSECKEQSALVASAVVPAPSGALVQVGRDSRR